jgi:hypothetical protein
MWRRVVWQKSRHVLKEPGTFCLNPKSSVLLTCGQQVPPNPWYPCTKLHCVTSAKIVTSVRLIVVMYSVDIRYRITDRVVCGAKRSLLVSKVPFQWLVENTQKSISRCLRNATRTRSWYPPTTTETHNCRAVRLIPCCGWCILAPKIETVF